MKNVYIVILVLFITNTSILAFNIQPKYASLTAKGTPLLVTIVNLKSSNVILKASAQLLVSESGLVTCPYSFDPKDCRAWVVAVDNKTGETDTCKISIVPWTVNLSKLSINETISGGYKIFGKSDDTLYVNYNNYLYKTGGDLKSLIPLSPFPILESDYYFGYLKTPAGSFIRVTNNIYYSKDEKKWVLDYTTKGRGVRNSFAYSYDSLSQTTRIFTHDYSVTGLDTFPHSVYRKTIRPNDKNDKWEKVFTFYSKDQWGKDQSLFPACRHIHTLVTDPYTGHLWIGTGDLGQLSHIYYSDDNGSTWKHIGFGTQEWRVLSIWFTDKYVYWAMDSSQTEKIFRISRNMFDIKGYWPDMSQKITTGYPQSNVMYMISSLKDQHYKNSNGTEAFVGDIVWGSYNTKNQINEANSLISINDPALDYREVVATLPNSALWSYTTVVDITGDNVVMISSNAEGQAIDNRIRIFGIKEEINGSVDIQELLSSNEATSTTSQFYPYEQDALGNIYFQPNLMGSKFKSNDIIKTKLEWTDNSKSIGGEVVSLSISNISNDWNLKLVNFEGSILEWQQADINLKWEKIQRIGSIANDTLNIKVKENQMINVRAIVKKNDFSPVPSKFIKVYGDKYINSVITYNNQNKNQFCIYPNPTKDFVNIQILNNSIKDINIRIFSLIGQLVYQKDYHICNGIASQVSLAGIGSGIYILQISNEHTIFNTEKLFVEF